MKPRQKRRPEYMVTESVLGTRSTKVTPKDRREFARIIGRWAEHLMLQPDARLSIAGRAHTVDVTKLETPTIRQIFPGITTLEIRATHRGVMNLGPVTARKRRRSRRGAK